MTIATGETLPDAELIRVNAEGHEAVTLSSLVSGRRVAIFGLPGAYTPTCTASHVPSFIRTKDAFLEKGVKAIICIAVNDPFVLRHWGEETGAFEAGIVMLADADGSFTRAIGTDFDAPAVGLYGRSARYAMLADDGEVRAFNVEEERGVCELTTGESLLQNA